MTDFLVLLQLVGQRKREELGKSVVPGDGLSISFDGVDIYTPNQTLLVKGLTFKLEVGKSLLLTGHVSRFSRVRFQPFRIKVSAVQDKVSAIHQTPYKLS